MLELLIRKSRDAKARQTVINAEGRRKGAVDTERQKGREEN